MPLCVFAAFLVLRRAARERLVRMGGHCCPHVREYKQARGGGSGAFRALQRTLLLLWRSQVAHPAEIY